MLTKEQFHEKIAGGIHFLDGATGSNLRKAGMPNGCCTEEWVLNHPEVLVSLQRRYAEAGCQILYAPTFQAQPIALKTVGLDKMTEAINAQLVALSRSAAPGCLIAGDLTTLAAYCDSWNPDNFDLLVENYRRQIKGLMDGGCDILVGETLMYPQEAEAILCAAELEGAGAAMYSFTMMGDGSLFSGPDAGPVLRSLEESGAAAVGFNCVGMDMMTPYLVTKLRRFVRGPLICKPNAGLPLIDENGQAQYSMQPEEFAAFALQCRDNGATLMGGCCGTDPDFLKKMIQTVKF
jgi:5-methyltetrahydrofolate--homocysteine methyltransferase